MSNEVPLSREQMNRFPKIEEPANLRFSDLVGQSGAVSRLKDYSAFYAKTGATPGHILITGEDGLGKANFAKAFADERGVPWQEAEAAELTIVGDVTALLTNFRDNQLLILNRVQALRKIPLARFVEAMSSGRLSITIGMGPAARTHVMDLRPFTLVATCPKKVECPVDLLPEFSLVLELQPYSISELALIATRIAARKNLELQSDAAQFLVRHCGRNPRYIEATLARVARAINKTTISEDDVREVFALFGTHVRADGSASPDKMAEMSGQDFERLISRLLDAMEFRSELTKVSGDGGIDIIAVLDKPIIGGKYLFQCKRYAPDNLVGASAVRDFCGAVSADRVVKGVFVTTSDFTPQAREFADKAGIELIDAAKLKALLHDHGLQERKSGLDEQNPIEGTSSWSRET
jgi:Holliday junction resolvasome RuvABC ATP-dependent DNA helicase subunit